MLGELTDPRATAFLLTGEELWPTDGQAQDPQGWGGWG